MIANKRTAGAVVLAAISLFFANGSIAATITGIVTGPSGLFDGAVVSALAGDESVLVQTTTDMNGGYTLVLPPEGAAAIRAESPLSDGLAQDVVRDVDFSFDREVRLFLVPEVTITADVQLPLELQFGNNIEVNPLDDYRSGSVFASREQLIEGVTVPAGGYVITVFPNCGFLGGEIFTCNQQDYFAYRGVDARAGDVSGITVPIFEPATGINPTAPMRAQLVSVSPADSNGIAQVTGAAGATDGPVGVAVFNVHTGQISNTVSAEDGSFSLDIFAPPGAWLALHQDASGVANFRWGEQMAPGSMIQAPIGGTPGVAFASGESINNPGEMAASVRRLGAFDGGQVWFSGDLADREWSAGETINLAGSMVIYSNHVAALDLGSLDTQVRVQLERVFDDAGKQELASPQFASSVLTPSGFPIDRADVADMVYLGQISFDPMVKNGNTRIEADWSANFTLPANLPDGLYQLVLEPMISGMPSDIVWFDRVYRVKFGPSLFSRTLLARIQVGTEGPRKLSWALGMNDFSNGSRGTVALEDQDRFAIAGHISSQSRDYILPMADARNGESIEYRLEPFAPLISNSNRGWMSPPSVPLSYPSGGLTVTITEPDGSETTVGPVAFAQPYFQEVDTPVGNRLGSGSNFPSQYYGLTTLDPRFDVSFEQYGKHVIEMTGTVDDADGRTHTGGGTYEVWVARTLDLETGVFPNTPFEVGDSFAPGLIVQPGVPADVEIRVRHYPESDPLQMVETLITGQANRFGYFHPSDHTPLVMTTPGEYRVDYRASYRDEQGVLWMGSASWGSVVATPASDLIVHGRRGLDNSLATSAWYNIRPTGSFSGHAQNPYFSGDIMWMEDLNVDPTFTADVPAMTVQDTVGAFASLYVPRHAALPPAAGWACCMSFFDSIGEIPFYSTTADGSSPMVFEDLVPTHWAYFYSGAARPGVRVREMVTENNSDNGYWRFEDPYNYQLGSGAHGDRPNDFKFQYNGAVYRAPDQDFFFYGAHGSLFVLLPHDDPVGGRIMPPFQGNSGGPDGGPIMSLKSEDIDMFLHLNGVRPGSILELGDTASFSGSVAPTLPASVSMAVTAPDGTMIQVAGDANAIGYFYRSAGDFTVDQPGIWSVAVSVTYDGQTSSGPTTMPFPTGHVLGSASGVFQFYVVDPLSDPLGVNLTGNSFVQPAAGPVDVDLLAPAGLGNIQVHRTVVMPGFILDQGVQTGLSHAYDATALSADFPNLDLWDIDGRAGVDTITMSYLLSGENGDQQTVFFARQVLLQGEELMLPGQRSSDWVFGNGFE